MLKKLFMSPCIPLFFPKSVLAEQDRVLQEMAQIESQEALISARNEQMRNVRVTTLGELLGMSFLLDITEESKEKRSLVGTDLSFLDMPLSSVFTGGNKLTDAFMSDQLSEDLVGVLQRKNPFCDAPVPAKKLKYSLDDGHVAAQRSVQAMLVPEGKLLTRRLQAIVTPEVQDTLAKLGITLAGNEKSGFFLNCDKTHRKLAISEENIRYALTRAKGKTFMDLGKVEQIQEALVEANKKLSTSVSIEQLLPHYYLFGIHPSEIEKHYDPKIQPVVRAVAKSLYVPRRDLSGIEKPKILLYSKRGGGGHLAQSKAIEGHLKSLGFETVIMHHDANAFDPLAYLTKGAASEPDPFDRVIQKKIGIDGRKLEDHEAYDEFVKYEDAVDTLYVLCGNDNHLEMARREMEDPSYVAMIDSFPFLTGTEGAAISNGLPYIRWSTDFDTWQGLLNSFDVLSPDQGRIALTTGDLIANRKLDLAVRDEKDVFSAIRPIRPVEQPVASANPKILQDGRVCVAGYPIRADIQKMSSDERNRVRAAMGVSATDKMIVVMMGSQGKKELYDIAQQLLLNPPENPTGVVHVVFAVGKNFAIKKTLKDLELSSENRGKIAIRFADEVVNTPNQFLDGKKMNDLLNSSDVLISKPGGSTTAEVLETETPIYMYGLNSGEEENAFYLLRSGLGVMHDEKKPIHSVLDELLKGEASCQFDSSFKLPNWRDSITSMLSDLGVPIPKHTRA